VQAEMTFLAGPDWFILVRSELMLF